MILYRSCMTFHMYTFFVCVPKCITQQGYQQWQISCVNTGFLLAFRGTSIYRVEVVESLSLNNLLF